MEQYIERPFKGLHIDNNCIDQPKDTYRFALNAVNKNNNGNLNFISNENSHRECGQISNGFTILNSCYISNNRNIIFSINTTTNISEIGILYDNCTYEILLQSTCLGFNINNKIDSTYRVKNECEEIVYFVDGSYIRNIDITNINKYYNDAYKSYLENPIGIFTGEKFNCDLFNLFPSYKIPAFISHEVISGGNIKSGSYNFSIQLLNGDLEPTNWIYSSQLVNIYNDDIYNAFNTIEGSSNVESDKIGGKDIVNKSIKLKLSNLDSNYIYYRIAIIEASNSTGIPNKVYYSNEIAINKNENIFIFNGNLEGYTNGTLEELKIPKSDYQSANHIEQIENKLILADLKGKQIDWCSFQSYASKIKSSYFIKEVSANDNKQAGNSKSSDTYWFNQGYQGGDVYAFGLVYVFKDGTESPVYHIPGRPKNKYYNPQDNTINNITDDTKLVSWNEDIEHIHSNSSIYNALPLNNKVEKWEYKESALKLTTPFNDYDSYGAMAFYESKTSVYENLPNCDYDYWGVDFNGTPLLGNKIRHHKFPSRTLETHMKYGIESNVSTDLILDFAFKAGVTSYPNPNITVTINYDLNGVNTNTIVLVTVTGSIVTYNNIITSYVGDFSAVTNITIIAPGYETYFTANVYKQVKSQSYINNSVIRLLGIRFDDIDYPHPDIVGHYIVRGDRDNQNRQVLDSGIMGNLITKNPKGINYSCFSYFTNNDNGATDDKLHNFLFTPKFNFYKELSKCQYIKLENVFTLSGKNLYERTYDGKNTNLINELDVIIDIREQLYNGTTTTFECDNNYKQNKLLSLDALAYDDLQFNPLAKTYNCSQTNRLQVVTTNRDFPKYNSDEINYITIRNNVDVHNSLDNIKYYRIHNSLLSNSSGNSLFGGDIFLSNMNMSNTLFRESHKSSLGYIVAGLLIVAAAVVAIATVGTGSGISAGLTAIGISIASGSIATTAIAATLAIALVGLTATAINAFNSNLETGLDELVNDDELDSLGSSTSSFLAYANEHIGGLIFETEINTSLRQGFNINYPSYFKYDRDINVYFRDKIMTYNNDCTDSERKGNGQYNCYLYNGATLPEIYHYNKDYSRQNKESVYFPLDRTYKCCSDCNEIFKKRIIWSNISTQEEKSDNYKIFLPNNYKDIEGETGNITDLFVFNNQLFIHTEEGLYLAPTTLQERINNNLLTYIGTGEFLSLPLQKVIDDSHSSAGNQHKWATLKTREGILYICENERKIYIYDKGITDLENFGIRTFLNDNLELKLNTLIKQYTGKDYVHKNNTSIDFGIGFITTYDSNYDRILITKIDYDIADEYIDSFHILENTTMTGLCYSLVTNKFYYQNTITEEVLIINGFDNQYFKNKSFTLSYSLENKSFTSWHSYLPYFYIYNNNTFSSLYKTNNKIMKHDDYKSFCKFNDINHDFIIDYISSNNPIENSIYNDVTLHTKATKNINGNLVEDRNITFNKVILYNNEQCSGLLNLIPKDKDTIDYLHNQVINDNDVIINRVENKWQFNNFRDYRIDYTIPIFSSSWNDIKNNYFIDKVLNTSSISFNKNWYELQSFNDKYLGIRLIFSNFDNYELIFNYSNETVNTSIR